MALLSGRRVAVHPVCITLVAALTLLPGSLHGQTIREYLTAGKPYLEERTLEQVLEHYEAAVTADSSEYDSLWKASLAAVTLSEADGWFDKRTDLLESAVRYARRAVATKPGAVEGHFCLAQALGRTALTTRDPRARVQYASEIREQARAALAADPEHAGAMHVLGVWHQNIMELSTFERGMAKTALGADYIDDASWEEAERHLEAAVALAPERVLHHLDLGRLYVARRKPDEARAQFRWILEHTPVDFNDDVYRRTAESALNMLGPGTP